MNDLIDAYVITLRGHEYSERVAARCIKTARDMGGIAVKYFNAVAANDAVKVMMRRGLEWTWDIVKPGQYYQLTGLAHHSYGGNLEARIGCTLSHYALWEKCAFGGAPILVLEHDSVFISPFEEFDFRTVCQINDPEGATPRGKYWHDKMVKRGKGVWPKTNIFNAHHRPDGLAGNSAYVIQPETALHLMELVRKVGIWPNDATICKQLVPHLQERYPFITRVDPEQSTINARML